MIYSIERPLKREPKMYVATRWLSQYSFLALATSDKRSKECRSRLYVDALALDALSPYLFVNKNSEALNFGPIFNSSDLIDIIHLTIIPLNLCGTVRSILFSRFKNGLFHLWSWSYILATIDSDKHPHRRIMYGTIETK